MNRKYTREDIRKSVKLLRDNFKEAILTADIIVGFPGETDIEFEETYDLLEEIKLYKIHVFQYSKRQGTKAAEYENQIAPEIKEERSKKIIELSKRQGEEYNIKYIGKTVGVLIEENCGNGYKGHTKNYMCVLVENAKKDIKGSIVKVEVKRNKRNVNWRHSLTFREK